MKRKYEDVLFNIKWFIMDAMPFLIVIGMIVAFIICWNAYAYRDIDLLTKQAPKFLKEKMEYKVVGDQSGYCGSLITGGSVYYNIEIPSTPGILYSVEVIEWRGVIQAYNPEPLNVNIKL